jgi:hypothetical protein
VSARKPNANPKPLIGVGSPQIYYLRAFGDVVDDAFGHTAYLVGSAATGKVWRDVDVRVILPNRLFRLLFGDPYTQYEQNRRWRSVTMAYSALGTHMTGLPIDFQPMSQAKADQHSIHEHVRVALFTLPDPSA